MLDVPYDDRTAEQLDALSLLASVEMYLKALPARQREIITLRVWEEKSFREIADLLGGTENAIKMAFSRSIRQLREVCGDAALLWLFIATALPCVSFVLYRYMTQELENLVTELCAFDADLAKDPTSVRRMVAELQRSKPEVVIDDVFRAQLVKSFGILPCKTSTKQSSAVVVFVHGATWYCRAFVVYGTPHSDTITT